MVKELFPRVDFNQPPKDSFANVNSVALDVDIEVGAGSFGRMPRMQEMDPLMA